MKSTYTATVAAAMMAVAAHAEWQHSNECHFSANGTSWDLSALRLVGDDLQYIVRDIRAQNTDMRYYFNVCADASIPGECEGEITEAEPAYQVDHSNDACYALGHTASDGWDFDTFDPKDPARGVMLRYAGGSSTWCSTGFSREMTLVFQCSPDVNNKFDLEQVTETNSCQYYIQLDTIHGCPLECLNSDATQICSGNGICGYDNDSERSRCFCNDGYEGSSCSSRTKPDPAITGEGIALIFLILLLVAVVGMVGFMYTKLRKLNVDPSAYQDMQGRFNELSMMTG